MSSWVSRIHKTEFRGVLAITGGGSLAISDLLTVPGASGTILESHIPYSSPSLAEYLGSPPEQACSDRTARALAMVGFWQARKLDPAIPNDAEEPPFQAADGLPSDTPHGKSASPWWGVGCTASLRSERPKRGNHRFHIALQTADLTRTYSLKLAKEARTRLEEERLTADFILHAVAAACQLTGHPEPVIRPDESLEVSSHRAPPGCRELVLGEAAAIRYHGELTQYDAHRGPARSLVIFPGAFNPPHDGHLAMAAFAERELGKPVELEISLENVDKPLLDYQEIGRRLAQLQKQSRPVWLTRAATFVRKAELFPESTFLVGIDTVIRIAEARYYASPLDRDDALATLRHQGCRFLVFGRLVEGRFQSLDELEIPHELRSLCIPVSADEFREDISSTALRRREQSSLNSQEELD